MCLSRAGSIVAFVVALVTSACAAPIEDRANGDGPAASMGDYEIDLGILVDALRWPVIFGQYRVDGPFSGYPKAEDAVTRAKVERPVYTACDDAIAQGRDAECASAGLAEWRRLVGSIAASDRAPTSDSVLRDVHRFVRRYRYVGERSGRDVWLTPLEFLATSGDCEDNAIIMYVTLRELGVPASDLFLVVGAYRPRPGTYHALLAVRRQGPAGDEVIILDNLGNEPAPSEDRLSDIIPLHVINEQSAFAVHHLIGSRSDDASEGPAAALGLECIRHGEAGAWTKPCTSTCPGDSRTFCAALAGGPACVHEPLRGVCPTWMTKAEVTAVRSGAVREACIANGLDDE